MQEKVLLAGLCRTRVAVEGNRKSDYSFQLLSNPAGVYMSTSNCFLYILLTCSWLTTEIMLRAARPGLFTSAGAQRSQRNLEKKKEMIHTLKARSRSCTHFRRDLAQRRWWCLLKSIWRLGSRRRSRVGPFYHLNRFLKTPINHKGKFNVHLTCWISDLHWLKNTHWNWSWTFNAPWFHTSHYSHVVTDYIII